ncbi:hypothetical protein PVAP13_3NG050990 [Panicum virgatum]|uniref:Uncharacterized protein n=1 Tax=Panicum virgatum TaxID=38727 RepID=A0A8T0TXQ5_PANVG|nr:hypothetical protein PVAP13_3NG050990 [Panicum virgatum]
MAIRNHAHARASSPAQRRPTTTDPAGAVHCADPSSPSCAPPPPPPPAFISHLLLSSPAVAPSLSLAHQPTPSAPAPAAPRVAYGTDRHLSISLSPLSDRRRPAASPEVRRMAYSSSLFGGPRRVLPSCIACWVFACFSGPDRLRSRGRQGIE